mgnify:CR=1 FL=1
MQVYGLNGVNYLDCSDGSLRIAVERDVLDLLSICGEHETDRVLLDWDCLDPAFFDLKTGLAGTVLLKLSMYRVKAALVMPDEKIGIGKFRDFMLETNRGNQFRIFNEREAAVEWLTRL